MPLISVIVSERRYSLPFEVVSASDGLKALEYLKSDPDVTFILSDINMPNMTGLEFLAVLKEDPVLRHIPVILQSAATEEEIQQGLDSGAELCLRKPYSGVDLYVAIIKILLQEVKRQNMIISIHNQQ
jgi:CheY-like chemotaxis protein